MENTSTKPLNAIRFSKDKQAWRYTTGGRSGFHPPFPSALVIVSWNVARSVRSPYQRLLYLLAYIKLALEKCRVESTITRKTEHTPPPCCILLQEVNAEGFAAILADEWVRKYFQVVSGPPSGWCGGEARYRNVTIVARSVPVTNVRSIEFGTGRNAVMVDVHLNVPANADKSGKGKERLGSVTVRICNARREGVISRTNELAAAVVEELRDDGIDGGIIGGDMDAVRVEDGALAEMIRSVEEKEFSWGCVGAHLEKILYWQYHHRFLVEEARILGMGHANYGILSLIRFREH